LGFFRHNQLVAAKFKQVTAKSFFHLVTWLKTSPPLTGRLPSEAPRGFLDLPRGLPDLQDFPNMTICNSNMFGAAKLMALKPNYFDASTMEMMSAYVAVRGHFVRVDRAFACITCASHIDKSTRWCASSLCPCGHSTALLVIQQKETNTQAKTLVYKTTPSRTS
jgi:hypothetical protein